MTKNPFKFSLVLFAITLLLFLGVYYFFANENYWQTSVSINSFVLPILYAVVTFLAVKSYRDDLGGRITFRQAFQRSFLTLFVGGFLSLFSIFLFLNYVDSNARDLLNYQFVQIQENKLEEAKATQLSDIEKMQDASKKEEFLQKYKDYKLGIEAAKKNKTNYFSLRYLSGIFGVFILFYLFLSIAIAAFLKNKKRYEELEN